MTIDEIREAFHGEPNSSAAGRELRLLQAQDRAAGRRTVVVACGEEHWESKGVRGEQNTLLVEETLIWST